MEPRVTLITLGVRDLERATRFYRDGLGWPLSSASTDDVSFLRGRGIVLALWSSDDLVRDAGVEHGPADAAPRVALAHNVGSRGEVDGVLEEARAAGAVITRPAHDTEWGGYSGYFADPEGHLWEVAWNPFWPLQPDGSVGIPE